MLPSFALSTLAFASVVAAGETDSGVRKQVRVVPNGRIAPSYQAGSHDDSVRRQSRKSEGKHELDWADESEKVDVFEQIYDVDGVLYRRAGGWTCDASTGAELIDTDASAKVNVTESQCLRECNQDPTCSCTRYSRYYGNKCWKMRNCPSEGHALQKCNRTDRFDTYIRQGRPSTGSVDTQLADPVGPTGPKGPGPWEKFGTDIFCFDAQLTHRHGQTPAGTYASQASCQALCASAPDCKFYLWRHDETAGSKYTCATFKNCDDPRPYKDGDGGHVWKKPLTHPKNTASALGFMDLGMGRCCVDNQGPLCRDSAHLFLRDQASSCESNCAGNSKCFGYSTVDLGHCYLWTELNLRFGGDTQAWEGAHCNVKTCVTTNSCATCADTPGWGNGHGFGCHSYEVHFCEGGKVKAGSEGWSGDGMRNPERHCCACGGGGA